MVVFPNAKINIGLRILRKRADGYHDIESVMVPVPWTDILEIVPAQAGITTLTVTGRHVECPTGKNLVMKAYRALSQRVEVPASDIYLHKIIPDGAGLGGGSADAAFTLTCLNKLYGLGLSTAALAATAAEIGADCPFFIYNRPMLATATGTTLEPVDVDLHDVTVAIVKPALAISTAEAYGGACPCDNVAPIDLGLPRYEWQETASNDFEKSLDKKYPLLSEIKRTLRDMGAFYASLSGSGSALFGLFENNCVDKLSAEMRKRFEGCDTFIGALD